MKLIDIDKLLGSTFDIAVPDSACIVVTVIGIDEHQIIVHDSQGCRQRIDWATWIAAEDNGIITPSLAAPFTLKNPKDYGPKIGG